MQETLGRYEQAEKPYRYALDIMDKSEQCPIICEIVDKLAGLYMELEREEDAVPLLERLCRLKEETVYQDQGAMAMAYNRLAEAYRICGRYDEAGKSFRHSLGITEELHGQEHPAVASVLQELAKLCERQGQMEEAKEYRNRAAVIFQNLLGEQEAGDLRSEKLTL